MTVNWKRTLYVMLFSQIITAIGFSSVFPFLPLYVKSLGSTTGLSLELLSGMVFSGQSLTMMFASPVWGALADRWGRKMMLVRATLGGAVLIEIMAFVQSAEQLVVLRMVQGLITGVVGASNALIASTVPREHTGFGMGLMQVGLGIGLGLGPLMGGAVADAYGFAAAFHITGALLLISSFIIIWGVEEKFQPAAKGKNRSFKFWEHWRHIFATPGVTAVYGLRFINHAGLMIFFPIMPLFVLMLLHNPERVNGFTGLIVGSASVSTAIFSVFLGRMGDRIGHHRVLIASSLASAVFFFLQSVVTDGYQLLAAHILSGAAMGGIGPAISALLAQYTTRGQEGAVYGLDNSIASGARALGPMLGVGISALLGLRAVFGAVAVLYFLTAAMAVFFMPRPKGRSKT